MIAEERARLRAISPSGLELTAREAVADAEAAIAVAARIAVGVAGTRFEVAARSVRSGTASRAVAEAVEAVRAAERHAISLGVPEAYAARLRERAARREHLGLDSQT